MIMKICDDIIEIMRILQLKVDDEYELEDPTNLMRKARHRLQEKQKMAQVNKILFISDFRCPLSAFVYLRAMLKQLICGFGLGLRFSFEITFSPPAPI